MFKNNILKNLLIINLFFLSIILFGKIVFVHRLINILYKSFLTPFIFAIFLFYIIKPINIICIKKGLSPNISAMLTIILGLILSIGCITFFSKYIATQFNGIIDDLTNIAKSQTSINNIINKINNYIPAIDVYKTFTNIVNTYTKSFVHTLMFAVKYIIHTFSIIFLIVVILFYLLKDGPKFRDKIINIVPKKYKEFISKTLSESDIVLASYVAGQAKVALVLSTMIFVSYKIIGIPNALLFASSTFILAFIPFIGFFISMIIPSIIALNLGFIMTGKLIIVFLVVQTLKGRVVVPSIMSKAMKIHPLTDIFLVIGAVALGGPLAAFAIVPIYAIIKTVLSNLYEYHIIEKHNN